MTIKNKALRKAEAISLVRNAGKTTIPEAMDKGLGMKMGLDAAGLRFVFNELVSEGVFSSRTATRKVRAIPYVGKSGYRRCKVVEFSLREATA